jgi:hypothetical protein
VAPEDKGNDYAVSRMFENDAEEQRSTVIDDVQRTLNQFVRKRAGSIRPGNFRLLEDLFDRILPDDWVEIYFGLSPEQKQKGIFRRQAEMGKSDGSPASTDVIVEETFVLSANPEEKDAFRVGRTVTYGANKGWRPISVRMLRFGAVVEQWRIEWAQLPDETWFPRRAESVMYHARRASADQAPVQEQPLTITLLEIELNSVFVGDLACQSPFPAPLPSDYKLVRASQGQAVARASDQKMPPSSPRSSAWQRWLFGAAIAVAVAVTLAYILMRKMQST